MTPPAIPAEAQQVIDALPPVAALVLVGLVMVGVVLWLLGRSLARAACAVSGLVLGGLAGYVAGEALSGQGAMTLPLVLGGAIAGALIAALLYRVWVGATTAAILALAAPAAVIIWQGTPITVSLTHPEAPDAARTAVEADERRERAEPRERTGDAEAEDPAVADLTLPPVNIEIEVPTWPSAEGDEATTASAEPRRESRPRSARSGPKRGEPAPAPDESVANPSPLPGPLAAIASVARTTYDRQALAIGGWWNELSSPARWLLAVASLVGAGVGLVLGLAAPHFAASLQTALVGGVLIFFPLRSLAEGYIPSLSGVLPTSPRATLLVLGLITLLGVLVQWTLFRRRADR